MGYDPRMMPHMAMMGGMGMHPGMHPSMGMGMHPGMHPGMHGGMGPYHTFPMMGYQGHQGAGPESDSSEASEPPRSPLPLQQPTKAKKEVQQVVRFSNEEPSYTPLGTPSLTLPRGESDFPIVPSDKSTNDAYDFANLNR